MFQLVLTIVIGKLELFRGLAFSNARALMILIIRAVKAANNMIASSQQQDSDIHARSQNVK